LIEERTVGNDKTIAWNGRRLQIPESRLRPHFVKAVVRVHEYPDDNFKFGLGYNFTHFSDDLTNLSTRNRQVERPKAGNPAVWPTVLHRRLRPAKARCGRPITLHLAAGRLPRSILMPIYALVLTTPPSRPALSALVVEHAWSLIPDIQRRTQEWLAPTEAWLGEFATNEADANVALKKELGRVFQGLTIDINIVTGDQRQRRKQLLVADMDSTIIQQECIDELADLAGLKTEVADITDRAMRGELDFEAALIHRVGLLEGLEAGAIARVIEERLTIMPGAITLVQTMRANGAFAALVSGGFTAFTSHVAGEVGFDVDQANRLHIAEGHLTGTVAVPILGREAKLIALQRYQEARGLAQSDTLAVGDGANDLAMIKAAGLGVAYRAKPAVSAAASASIVYGDLTSLLFLQGYKRAEFI
jgi:phosphoserine phosphatase